MKCLILTRIPRHVNEKSKIVYNLTNIDNYNKEVFKGFNSIWNRIVRDKIYLKGLYLLNDAVLNIYKNAWEDGWHNFIINKVSNNLGIIDRVGYIYFEDGSGEGTIKIKTEAQKDKMIKEFLGFLYFDYNMLPINDNKSGIIKKLKVFCKQNAKIKIKFLRSKYYILTNLVETLIDDTYISKDDKVFLYRLLKKAKLLEENNNKKI